MTSLIGLTAAEIATECSLPKPFMATQIFEWIHKRAVDTFDQMTNISLATRQALSKSFTLWTTSVLKTFCDEDGTKKLQIKTFDGSVIECVLLTDKDGRRTACVSSEAGCRMACAFCKTGSLGWSRALSAGEILEQFMLLERLAAPGHIDNLVFMGMGEPLCNLKAVSQATSILSDPKGRGFSIKRVTVSTCGVIEGIKDLTANGPYYNLAISLVAAIDEKRNRLMPVNRQAGLAALKSALIDYAKKSHTRLTLEACLLSGVNTNAPDAQALFDFAKSIEDGSGERVNINLIPWNAVPGFDFSTPSREEVAAFEALLAKASTRHPLTVTVRHKRGTSSLAACGQLGAVKLSPKTK